MVFAWTSLDETLADRNDYKTQPIFVLPRALQGTATHNLAKF